MELLAWLPSDAKVSGLRSVCFAYLTTFTQLHNNMKFPLFSQINVNFVICLISIFLWECTVTVMDVHKIIRASFGKSLCSYIIVLSSYFMRTCFGERLEKRPCEQHSKDICWQLDCVFNSWINWMGHNWPTPRLVEWLRRSPWFMRLRHQAGSNSC